MTCFLPVRRRRGPFANTNERRPGRPRPVHECSSLERRLQPKQRALRIRSSSEKCDHTDKRRLVAAPESGCDVTRAGSSPQASGLACLSINETPLTFYLERDTFKRHELTLRDDDYRTRTVQVHKNLNTTALSNCTFILSWGTDALTGAMMEYSPDSYFIELEPKRAQRAMQDRDLMLFIVASSTRLLNDIARGDGEALRAVEKLSGIPPTRHDAFLAALRGRFDAMAREQWPTRLYAHVRQSNSSTLASRGSR